MAIQRRRQRPVDLELDAAAQAAAVDGGHGALRRLGHRSDGRGRKRRPRRAAATVRSIDCGSASDAVRACHWGDGVSKCAWADHSVQLILAMKVKFHHHSKSLELDQMTSIRVPQIFLSLSGKDDAFVEKVWRHLPEGLAVFYRKSFQNGQELL